jgi:peptidyl-prolyl cis-trans isomerase SurA
MPDRIVLAPRGALSLITLAVCVAGAGAVLAQPTAGALAPASSPASSSTPRAADFIVAVVNSEPITNNEVRARLLRLERQLARQGGGMPPREALLREALDQLIAERTQLQLARESGIRVDGAMVDQAERDLASQNGVDVDELRQRAAAEGLTAAQLRDDLRRQILLTRLRQQEVEARIVVSEPEIEDFLREQAAAGPKTEQINLAQVLVSVPETASAPQVDALRAKAERIRQRAQAGEDFARLVREASDAPNAAAQGGAFGLRPTERYPTLFSEAVRAVPVGGVSEVVRSGAGFHVLKVLERQTETALTIPQQRARHILLRPGPRLSEAAARQRLEEFRQRIEAGQADFADLAREHSQDGSASAGGDLGWAGPGLFVPEFEAVLARLAPGQLAPPFVSRFGVHLVQLMERRQAPLSARERRELARNAVRERKLDEAYVRWAQDVRGRAFVQLREPPQ